MNPPRTPVIAGLTGGAGTSTLAAALHASDNGRASGTADVLVCRSAEASLRHAAALPGAPPGPRPVLAVILDAAVPAPDALAARLRGLESRFGAVVLVPHVARWHGLSGPCADAAAVLAQPVEHLPLPLQPYAAAMRLLVAAMVRSGQLGRSAPPTVSRPRTVQLWHGLQPVERGVSLRSPRAGTVSAIPTLRVPEPDDDALEADLPRATPTERASTLPPARWAG